ncbi:protein-disulfide reductase DsbD domain-containing protein [Mesorhizobium sp. KR9-304]|uniref:protein-disulfide reductase DsbD domain-containing protein n=1 Tax=Mesorhizobium sp. KR9-304 TaxID=3156614 RepID=UPI0032B38167
MKALSASAILFALLIAAPARAASSDWFEMEGARVRLVTAGKPDALGRLRGALDIELKPGWKTYWRDPGDAGVPPTIDASANPNIDTVAFDFPAPQRHDESDFKWAGYDYPVALPVTFKFKDPAGSATIDANVFLGVCETICVPVQAKLAVDPGADDPEDVAAVSAAFADIPPPARPDFGLKVASKPGDAKALLEVTSPGDAGTAELFLAGEDGYVLSTPDREIRDGTTFFVVEVTRPDEAPTGPGLHYTLVTEHGAVSGFLPYL